MPTTLNDLAQQQYSQVFDPRVRALGAYSLRAPTQQEQLGPETIGPIPDRHPAINAYQALPNFTSSLSQITNDPDAFSTIGRTMMLGGVVGGASGTVPGAVMGAAAGIPIGIGMVAARNLSPALRAWTDIGIRQSEYLSQWMPAQGMVAIEGKPIAGKALDDLIEQLYLKEFPDMARAMAGGRPQMLEHANDMAGDAALHAIEALNDKTVRNYPTLKDAKAVLHKIGRDAINRFLSSNANLRQFAEEGQSTLDDVDNSIFSATEPITPVDSAPLPSADDLTSTTAATVVEGANKRISKGFDTLKLLRPRDQRIMQTLIENSSIRQRAAQEFTQPHRIREIKGSLQEAVKGAMSGDVGYVPLAKGWRKDILSTYTAKDIERALAQIPKENQAATRAYLFDNRKPSYLQKYWPDQTPDKLFGNLRELKSIIDSFKK